MIYKNRLVKTVRYKVDAVTVSPLSIKQDEENLKIDETTGKFYIPGSSITGAFRNYYEKNIKKENENNDLLFGGPETGMNRLICYDAFPGEDSVKRMLSSRPGLKIDRRRLTVYFFESMGKKTGSKFTRKFVNDGIKFTFTFELNNYDKDCDFNKAQENFEHLLWAFANGDILLGNNKTVGFGRFKVKSIKKAEYDFGQYNDVIRYLLKEEKYEDITGSVLNPDAGKTDSSHFVRFKITGKTTTPLLIKDEVVRLPGLPDGINIKNGEDKYVIPGSALKGVLRTRIEKIVKTFPSLSDTLITNIFGLEANKEEQGSISRLICYDTVINNSKTGIYHKIKIDYFTGGVQQSALVSEETVMGDLEIECVFNTNGLKQYDKEVGLILLALRDLCTEKLNVGGGYAVGRGYIKADKLEFIDSGKEKIVYDFESPDKSAIDRFNSYIYELMVG